MRQCPACAASLADDAVFCTDCGYRLGAVAAAATGDGASLTSPSSSPNSASPASTPLSDANSDTMAAGRIVDGKYRIVRVLGEGGMGVVYLARALHTDVDVVIKAVRPEIAHRQDIRNRTFAEGRALARIDHPNVVQLKTVIVDDTDLLLVMQFIDGESLEDLIERHAREQRPIGFDHIVRMFAQICDGVHAAHEDGIVHRDLKPANILIRKKDGVIKVTDFGIAKPLDDSERKNDTKGIIGSVHYMAPEQVRGVDELDARCDIYALGILLYQMLVGRVPFDADSTYEILRMQCDAPLPSIMGLRPDVPPAIDGVLQQACAKDRSHRFTTTQELKIALEMLAPSPAGRARPAKTIPGEPVPKGATREMGPLPPGLTGQVPQSVPLTSAPAKTGAGPSASDGHTGPYGGQHTGQHGYAPTQGGYGPPTQQHGTITGQSTALPPQAPSSGGMGWLVPVGAVAALAVVGVLLVVGGVVELGGDEPEPVAEKPKEKPSKPGKADDDGQPDDKVRVPVPNSPLATLSGRWISESGRAFDAVQVGDLVEFRIVDASQFEAQGYRLEEPRFVLHPIDGETETFAVEDRLRPLPPIGHTFDSANARATCLAVFKSADGDDLEARLSGDRLIVDFAKFEPTAKNFVIAGKKVVSCVGLESLAASRTSGRLTREPSDGD